MAASSVASQFCSNSAMSRLFKSGVGLVLIGVITDGLLAPCALHPGTQPRIANRGTVIQSRHCARSHISGCRCGDSFLSRHYEGAQPRSEHNRQGVQFHANRRWNHQRAQQVFRARHARRVQAVLRAKGIRVFARVDHSGEAEEVGMKMPPTQLLIFGSPKAGTPVMLVAPTAAIDLPLKALAWPDRCGERRPWHRRQTTRSRRRSCTPNAV
jgi:uncharacterized protein (DUF302 family)